MKLNFLLLSLVTVFAIALSACGQGVAPPPAPTPTPTPVPIPEPTSIPVPVGEEACDRGFPETLQPNGGSAWDRPGGEFWLSISPGEGNWQVNQYLIYIIDQPSGYELRIYDDEATLVFSQEVTTEAVVAGGIGWQTVDLAEEGIVVSGDFFVAIRYLQEFAPVVGVNVGPSTRSWVMDPEGELATMAEFSQGFGFPDREMGLGACFVAVA